MHLRPGGSLHELPLGVKGIAQTDRGAHATIGARWVQEERRPYCPRPMHSPEVSSTNPRLLRQALRARLNSPTRTNAPPSEEECE